MPHKRENNAQPLSDWQKAVAMGYTELGYKEWLTYDLGRSEDHVAKVGDIVLPMCLSLDEMVVGEVMEILTEETVKVRWLSHQTGISTEEEDLQDLYFPVIPAGKE